MKQAAIWFLLLGGMLHGVPHALAQSPSATPLSQICDDCTLRKFASCPEGKFLEGPNFDRDGVLWMVSLRTHEILKATSDGQCSVVADVGGYPGGGRFDHSGKYIVTDRSALMSFDTATSKMTAIVSSFGTQNFKGLNDVIVDKAGGMYFTDPNGSNAMHPNGRVFYLPPDRSKDIVLIGDMYAFPNGLVLSPDERLLYIGEYALNRIMAVPLSGPGMVAPLGSPYVFAYMVGGIGPDGMLVDQKGDVYSAHYQAGEIAIQDPSGFPIGQIRMPPGAGRGTTNLAFHDGYLYVTEASRSEVWRVATKIPGMY